MVSDAVTEPPGESTRNTIADTESSCAASRRAAAMVSPPALDEPNGNREPPRPLTIDPATVITAIVDLGPRPGIDGPPGPVARAYRLTKSRGGASSSSASPDSGETPFGANQFSDSRVGLVTEPDAIDQPRLDGDIAQQRRAVGQTVEAVLADLARLGYRLPYLAAQAFQQPGVGFPVGVGVAVLRENVYRRLVFAA